MHPHTRSIANFVLKIESNSGSDAAPHSSFAPANAHFKGKVDDGNAVRKSNVTIYNIKIFICAYST